MGLLSGKTALITGAARGIGKAVAIKFAQEGANIAFTDYDTAAEIRVSFQELHLIENGKVKPKKETIKKICDYFNVNYNDYL